MFFFLANSILIKASQSIFVKAFNQIFQENYFFDEIRQSAINSSVHMDELNKLIQQQTGLPNETIVAFQIIQADNKRMLVDLEQPLQELCNYANGTDADIDQTIIEALDQVHQQLRKLIDTIQKDFLNQMPSGGNGTLINKNLEDQIRWYVRLVGIILLVLVIVIGLIPIIFFIFITICCLSNGRSSRVLCCMRILITPMIIILIVIVLVSDILYGVDLFAQGACRTVHDDRQFLVPFLIGNN